MKKVLVHCANQKVFMSILEIVAQEDGFQVKVTNIQSDTAIVDHNYPYYSPHPYHLKC